MRSGTYGPDVGSARLGARTVGIDASAVTTGRARDRRKADIQIVRGEATLLPFATDAFATCHTERALQYVSDLPPQWPS